MTNGALALRTALGKSPLVRALKEGRVASDRVSFAFVDVDPITRAFRRQTRGMEFDLCEIALTTHAQARDFGKPITALPVVLLHGLHHGALITRRDSPLRGPADLVGKRVGVRAWSQTTGVWVRGVLRHEYGIAHESMTWVTEEDAHVQEFTDPPFVQRIASGQSLPAMLLSGEIDAGIALPVDSASVRPVIVDTDAAAAAWSRKTGVHPINHVVVVKDALLAEHPWLANELMRLFRTSREHADPDAIPFALAPHRPAIDLLMRYAAEQGLLRRPYAVEELFAT